MSSKDSSIKVTDQFAGCGGSSSGANEALEELGISDGIGLALNHWPLAVETHNTNFPKALHDCADISATDPRRYPSTHVLLSSPECTHQTNADGKVKPVKQFDLFKKQELNDHEERSRATMWDVPRFAEYHKYELIICENVVEARKWVMFDSWIHAMRSLGYNHKCCFLNSMHFNPCPQSRDRMYVVFWKKGNPAPNLNYNPNAYCKKCTRDVLAVQSWKPNQKTFKYKTGYVYCCPSCTTIVEPYYYAAFNVIDWTDPGRIIGDRLAPNTLRRISLGKEKFWTETTTLPEPLILKTEHAKNETGYIKSSFDHLYTQATRQTFGVVTPPPFIVENKGQSNAREITEAISTMTCKVSHGILIPDVLKSFISYYNGGSDVSSHILDVVGSFTTKDRAALVNYKTPDIKECYYRVLKAHEVKLGMAFNPSYKVLGSGKDQVRQLGNAVTPPVMKWLVKRGVQSFI